MEKDFPKILAVSLNAWRKESASHTQTDLFKFWKPSKVAQVYTRSELPNTDVCDSFFQISENAIIKSVFSRKPVGKEVKNGSVNSITDENAITAENKLYYLAHKRKSWLLTLAREIVWDLGCWKTKQLEKFVMDFNPDVYFIPIYPVVYMGKLQRYLLKKHPRPYVCYLADDNYSYANCGKNVFAYIHRFFLRKQIKALAENCDEMFTITKTEAEDTDRLFGTHSIVLTKGINYDGLSFEDSSIKDPIKMVYTGSLVIGRDYSLAAIAKALENINREKIRIILEIYSPDIPTKKHVQIFNSNGCYFKGKVPLEEVRRIQLEADVVVFVESLEKAHRFAARLSFSTKLTDYFKSGKCIFAIGDETIAPIMYLRDNDAAVISTAYEQIEDNLRRLVESPELIKQYSRKAFECGKRNHDESIIRERFVSTFLHAASGEKQDDEE